MLSQPCSASSARSIAGQIGHSVSSRSSVRARICEGFIEIESELLHGIGTAVQHHCPVQSLAEPAQRMKPPDLPDNEAERVRLLHELRILDTGDEPAFDAIARMVCLLSGCPIGALSLVDTERQWFKAIVGLTIRETPRRHSLCARALLRSGITVVEDTLADPELATHPLVLGEPRIRFYAA